MRRRRWYQRPPASKGRGRGQPVVVRRSGRRAASGSTTPWPARSATQTRLDTSDRDAVGERGSTWADRRSSAVRHRRHGTTAPGDAVAHVGAPQRAHEHRHEEHEQHRVQPQRSTRRTCPTWRNITRELGDEGQVHAPRRWRAAARPCSESREGERGAAEAGDPQHDRRQAQQPGRAGARAAKFLVQPSISWRSPSGYIRNRISRPPSSTSTGRSAVAEATCERQVLDHLVAHRRRGRRRRRSRRAR